MATKKYTVTLPEDLAQEIRRKVGPGAFSAYVTDAVRRKFENDKLGELVEWMLEEHGPLTEAQLAEADAEFRQFERIFAEREQHARQQRAAIAPTEPVGDEDTTVTSDTAEEEIDHPLAA
jgi:Arc/MetJ-type ribon-helix-helix transcriptional regulator